MFINYLEVILHLYLPFVCLPFILAYICNSIEKSNNIIKLKLVIVLSIIPFANIVASFVFLLGILCNLIIIFVESKNVSSFLKPLEDKFENKKGN